MYIEHKKLFYAQSKLKIKRAETKNVNLFKEDIKVERAICFLTGIENNYKKITRLKF